MDIEELRSDPGRPALGRASPRQRLLDAAVRLFGASGIRATGIDRLLSEAGVAKMSLYQHFEGKDGLVVAALHRQDQLFRAYFRAVIESRTDPRARVLGVFSALERWFARGDFRGSLFLNVAAELPDPACEARRVIRDHEVWVLGQFRSLCNELGARDPDDLAAQLMVLFDGAIARALVTGDAAPAREAGRAAASLLDASRH